MQTGLFSGSVLSTHYSLPTTHWRVQQGTKQKRPGKAEASPMSSMNCYEPFLVVRTRVLFHVRTPIVPCVPLVFVSRY
jgi:hypothetical protein